MLQVIKKKDIQRRRKKRWERRREERGWKGRDEKKGEGSWRKGFKWFDEIDNKNIRKRERKSEVWNVMICYEMLWVNEWVSKIVYYFCLSCTCTHRSILNILSTCIYLQVNLPTLLHKIPYFLKQTSDLVSDKNQKVISFEMKPVF